MNKGKVEVLSRGRKVIVFGSDNCSCVNVTLPNINFHFKLSGFNEFTSLINDYVDNWKEEESIFIDTPISGMSLHFTFSDLDDLFNTLLEAKVQLELKDIFSEKND